MCKFVVQTVVDENLIGGNISHIVRIRNIIPPESQDVFHTSIHNEGQYRLLECGLNSYHVLITFIGIFIAGIVSMVIAFLLITVFCCVFMGLRLAKSRSSSRFAN